MHDDEVPTLDPLPGEPHDAPPASANASAAFAQLAEPLTTPLEDHLNAALYGHKWQNRAPASPSNVPQAYQSAPIEPSNDQPKAQPNSVEPLPTATVPSVSPAVTPLVQPLATSAAQKLDTSTTEPPAKAIDLQLVSPNDSTPDNLPVSQNTDASTSVPSCLNPPARTDLDPPSTEESIATELSPWKARYVNALIALGGNKTLAAKACGRCLVTVNHHQANDPKFDKWIRIAGDMFADLIEGAMFVSATTGDLEPVFQGGVQVGFKRRKNVQAAQLLLAAKRPDYRRGSEGSTVNNTQNNVSLTVVSNPEQVHELANQAASRLFGRGREVAGVDEVPEIE